MEGLWWRRFCFRFLRRGSQTSRDDGVLATVKASSVASRNQDQDGDWSRTASVLVPAAMFGVVFAVACVSVVALFVSSSSSLSPSSPRSAAS